MGQHKTVLDDLREGTRDLRTAIPAVFHGFAQLHDATFAPGALDAKTKELIALAIAVAILMNGGPATIYGPRAFAALQEFAPAHHPAPGTAEQETE